MAVFPLVLPARSRAWPERLRPCHWRLAMPGFPGVVLIPLRRLPTSPIPHFARVALWFHYPHLQAGHIHARRMSESIEARHSLSLASLGAFYTTTRLELRLIMSIQGGSGISAPRQSRPNPCLRVIPQDLRDPHIRANDLCVSSHTPARAPPFGFGGARASISQRIPHEL